MKATTRRRHRTAPLVLIVTGLLAANLIAIRAAADSLRPTDVRVSSAGEGFENAVQYAIGFRIPTRLRADHIELAMGTISAGNDSRAFLSAGPVWRKRVGSTQWFATFSFSPTVIGGSTFNGRELGGNFHFTSAASIGRSFGRHNRVSVVLRVSHLSNGGIHSTNPGMDMVGLSVRLKPSH